jgi:hypothetical protein
MRTISRTQLRQQAQEYAREIIEFAERENSEASSRRAPLVRPNEVRSELERRYQRFVARWCLVQP